MRKRRLLVFFLVFLIFVFVAFFRFFSSRKIAPPEFSSTQNFDPQKGIIPKGVKHWSAKEPAFSLSLKPAWFLQEVPGSTVTRLSASSESHYRQDFKYQAIVGVNLLTPKSQDWREAIEKEKTEIAQLEGFQSFLSEDSVKIGLFEGKAFEWLSRIEAKPELKEIAGEKGLLIHHRDILILKDKYLVNIFAAAYEWAWPEFVTDIEDILGSFTFLENQPLHP